MLIRLLSLNIWDLPFPFPGSNRGERRRALLSELRRLDPDIVLLQEAFRIDLREEIWEALPSHYADARAVQRGGMVPFLPQDISGGLLTLSRWPVPSTQMTRWRHVRPAKLDERLARKGALWTEIETPAGVLLVCNVHTHAGRTPADARARVAQVGELLAEEGAMHTGAIIVAGDLNIDPAVSPDDISPNGLDLLEDAGFAEVALAANDGLGTVVPQTNRYARVGFRRPDHRRLTHVWYRGPGITAGPVRPEICFNHPPVSDHYGLLATLELSPL